MKKHLIIAAIAIAIIVATIAISFAAWDIFSAKNELTFKTGDSVKLDIAKDTGFTTTKVLVPTDAMKPTADYVYEMQIAKDVELKNTSGIAAIDSLEYVWDLTKVTVKDDKFTQDKASLYIKDVATFKEEFTIVLRPNDATDSSKDVAYGGKIDLSTASKAVKYNVFVKFNKATDAQAQKKDADNKLVYVDTNNSDAEISYTYAEYNALDTTRKAQLKALYAYTDSLNNDAVVYYTTDDYAALTADQKKVLTKKDYFNTDSVPEFTLRGIKLEITIEAANKAANN